MKKTLVAYFSTRGVTEKTAKTIAEITNADSFEIEPKVPYTDADLDWTDKTSRSSIEMGDKNSRPEIKNKLSNMDEYEVVFLGFPIWWYVAPTIINTFLESYDFSGKTIIPFATSGGSGMGNTDEVLHNLLPDNVKWKTGKLLNFANKTQIENWIKDLNI